MNSVHSALPKYWLSARVCGEGYKGVILRFYLACELCFRFSSSFSLPTTTTLPQYEQRKLCGTRRRAQTVGHHRREPRARPVQLYRVLCRARRCTRTCNTASEKYARVARGEGVSREERISPLPLSQDVAHVFAPDYYDAPCREVAAAHSGQAKQGREEGTGRGWPKSARPHTRRGLPEHGQARECGPSRQAVRADGARRGQKAQATMRKDGPACISQGYCATRRSRSARMKRNVITCGWSLQSASISLQPPVCGVPRVKTPWCNCPCCVPAFRGSVWRV